MKATGLRIERETVILFNDVENTAEIWTASNKTYKRLIKRGFCPVTDNQRSATFKIPSKCVSIRKPNRISEKRLTNLVKARSKARPTSDKNSLYVQ